MSNRFVRPFVVGLLSTGLLSMASALAWADDGSVVLDLVRHGETLSNLNGVIDTAPPGAPLDSTGVTEAQNVANSIYGEFGKDIAGIYASEATRTQETATPLVELLGNSAPPVDILAGLNEIPAGAFEGEGVGLGAPAVDAPHPVENTGGEEQPLGEAGLTGVDVRQDPQVQQSSQASCPLRTTWSWT